MSTPAVQVQVDNAHYIRTIGGKSQIVVGPVSFDIRGGEFMSIIGPASCGMTALLKMIAGILQVTGGEIRISGAKLNPPCRDFGLVLHEPALLPWRTCMQNILLHAEMRSLDVDLSRNRARRLLAWFGLSRFEEMRPHELPPGAAQAISICRAMVHEPSLLLMDEPLGSLNPLELELMLDGFQRLWAESGTTAMLCTCNMEESVLLSDRIAVMSPRPGRILEIISIDLPRPRRLDKKMTPQIAEYCSRIRTVFRAQGILP